VRRKALVDWNINHRCTHEMHRRLVQGCTQI
jgi:hypothetical protein